MKVEGNLAAETLTPSLRQIFCELLRRVYANFLLLGRFWLSTQSTLYATDKFRTYVSFEWFFWDENFSTKIRNMSRKIWTCGNRKLWGVFKNS